MRRQSLLRYGLPCGLLVGFGIVAATGSAFAANAKSRPTGDALPGVGGGYSIVKPLLPESDDAASGVSTSGRFKVGNTDVRISGSITVDLGVGSLGHSRR